MNWRGKDAVLNHHLYVPYHLLKCEPELSAGCPGSGNLIVDCTLGAPMFRGNGSLNEELIRDVLARHLFFTEFGEPPTTPPPPGGTLVGTFRETALHLLWEEDGHGFLDTSALRSLPVWDGELIIYGERLPCRPASCRSAALPSGRYPIE